MFFTEKRYDLGLVGPLQDQPPLQAGRRRRQPPAGAAGRDRDHEAPGRRSHEKDLEIDDIDHLGNRRVRAVGELLQNQIRVGLAELEKTARERMAIIELENLLPHNLINAKPVVSAIKDFFGRSQLSQFMDQTNPLSELTHKRRLSALGPGRPLARPRRLRGARRAPHALRPHLPDRDAGRPEHRPDLLAVDLRPHQPVRLHRDALPQGQGRQGHQRDRVHDGRRRGRVSSSPRPTRRSTTRRQARRATRSCAATATTIRACAPDEVDYMDVSPKQLVSVSASLIPFLEHDDANRALMGSNMQRQAVPLLYTEPPVVGTGIEAQGGAWTRASASSPATPARSSRVTADEIVDHATRLGGMDHYKLQQVQALQPEHLHQPEADRRRRARRSRPGEVLADGPATADGELALGTQPAGGLHALGRLQLRGRHPAQRARWCKDDIFTSIHIEEFEIDARDTKLGKEEITRDIPNVSEEALAKLDENGLVYIGAEVEPGDILVGKVTPKGETELTSEEKLLRAIFGEKAGDVRDASPARFPRAPRARWSTSRSSAARNAAAAPTARTSSKHHGTRTRSATRQLRQRLVASSTRSSRTCSTRSTSRSSNFETGKTELKPGRQGHRPGGRVRAHMPAHGHAAGGRPKAAARSSACTSARSRKETEISDTTNNKIDRIKTGDELPPGVIKLVKVYVATKRKISVGDKMAGRHGNKGVVAKIMPVEDMPFLADGTPVDIVLNPLGVPSRMNVGQILETHLGWAADGAGHARWPRRSSTAPTRTQIRDVAASKAGPARRRGQTDAVRRPDRRAVRPPGDRRRHLHAEAGAPGRRQDARPLDRPLLAGDAAAAGRQGAVRRPALRRDGSVGARGLRRGLHAAGTADGQERRRARAARRSTSRSSRARTPCRPACPSRFNVLVKELQGLCLNMELLSTKDLARRRRGRGRGRARGDDRRAAAGGTAWRRGRGRGLRRRRSRPARRGSDEDDDDGMTTRLRQQAAHRRQGTADSAKARDTATLSRRLPRQSRQGRSRQPASRQR